MAPRTGPPPQPVSTRLIKRLIHPDHEQVISTTFFTPDGRWLLAACLFSGGLQIWDAHSGEQVRTLWLPKPSAGMNFPPVLSPDGRTLYAPVLKYQTTPTRKDGKARVRFDMDGAITVWEVASGKQLPSLKHSPPHGVFSFRPSPDGAILLSTDVVSGVGRHFVLTQWDLRTRKHHRLLDGWWGSVGFAPDGKTFIAVSSDPLGNAGKLVLWDVASRTERRVIAEAHKGRSFSALSPDGRTLAAVEDLRTAEQPPGVKLWDVASGKEVGGFTAPTGTNLSRPPGSALPAFDMPAFSPDSRWLAACLHTGRVYLYDVAGRKLAWSQDVKNRSLRQPAFSPDGRWLAVAAQELPADLKGSEKVSPFDLPQPRIFLFDLKAGGPAEEVVAPHGQMGSLAFSPDSKTIALSGTGCVWLFDVSRPGNRK